MVRTSVDLTTWDIFDEASLPFFFNRVSESFELLQHRHDFMELAYADEGSGFHYIDDENMQVAKGDLFVLPIGVSHVFRPAAARPRSPLIVYNCIFRPEPLASRLGDFPGGESLARSLRLLRLAPGGEPGWSRIRDSEGHIGAWFRLAHREYIQRRPGCAARLYAMFIELAVLLERQLSGASSAADAPVAAADSLDAAIAHIDAHFAEPLAAARIAAEFRMSERHFHRLFKRRLGCTFSSYVQNKRIGRSCALLTGSRMTVQEIAQQAGYQDMKFFLSVFRKITGCTPREYRKRNG